MQNTSHRKITKSVVDRLQPGQTVWDTKTKGFGVRCQARARSYILKKNIKGRQRLLTIGQHGCPWTAEQARNQAVVILGQIAEGNDPAKERDDLKDRPTIADLCARFIEEYARDHKRESSVKEDQRNINNHVLPLIGRELVADLTISDVSRFQTSIKNGKTERGNSKRKGGRGAANRCLSLLSKMINEAIAWGWRPDNINPVKHVKRYAEHKCERFLSQQEFEALASALNEAEEQGAKRKRKEDAKFDYAVAAIRLFIFTGARRSEILSLRWDQVDLDAGMLRLAKSKTGPKVIYLSAPAIELLNDMPREVANPHVICGRKQGKHIVNIRKPWLRIRDAATIKLWLGTPEIAALRHRLADEPATDEVRALAEEEGIELPPGLLDVRLHDLRHSFASVAAANGLSLPMIGKLLGHTQAATTQRYAHLADDPVRAANDAIGESIQASMQGKSAQVIKLHQ